MRKITVCSLKNFYPACSSKIINRHCPNRLDSSSAQLRIHNKSRYFIIKCINVADNTITFQHNIWFFSKTVVVWARSNKTFCTSKRRLSRIEIFAANRNLSLKDPWFCHQTIENFLYGLKQTIYSVKKSWWIHYFLNLKFSWNFSKREAFPDISIYNFVSRIDRNPSSFSVFNSSWITLYVQTSNINIESV